MNEMLPPELARRWGNLRWIKQRGTHEWSSECVKCHDLGHGGTEWPDRFRMFSGGKPRCYCRHCGYTDFADSDRKEFKITPEMRLEWLKEREEREKAELSKTMTALALLKSEGAWLRYHDSMGIEGRKFWESKGVPEWAVNYYQLGWCYDKAIWTGGQEHHTPTATIPIFAPGWALVNLRHRLINPPKKNDKYRPDRAGLGQSLYLTDPDKAPSGETIIVEGEIKAIVLRSRIDRADMCIVGVPGKTPSQKTLDKLGKCDRIHVILDPDATRQAGELAQTLGTRRARVVTLPDKVDDCFTMRGMTESQFMSALKCGRVVM